MLAQLALCGDCVERFARLGNEDEKRVRQDNRITVSILACIVDLDGQPCQRFDHVLTGDSGMPTGTARENADVLEASPYFVAESNVFEMNAAGVQRKPSEDCVLDGDRLL